jgi:hypothetical protein
MYCLRSYHIYISRVLDKFRQERGSRQRHPLAKTTTCSANNFKVYVPFWVEGHCFQLSPGPHSTVHTLYTPPHHQSSHLYSITFRPFRHSQLRMHQRPNLIGSQMIICINRNKREVQSYPHVYMSVVTSCLRVRKIV